MTRYFDDPSDPRKWRTFWKLMNQDPLPELRPTTPDHQWLHQEVEQLRREIRLLRERNTSLTVELRNAREELEDIYNGILIT